MLTLEQIAREGRRLIVLCNGCGHRVLVVPSELPLPGSMTLDEARGHFGCTRCPTRDVLLRAETGREVRKASLR